MSTHTELCCCAKSSGSFVQGIRWNHKSFIATLPRLMNHRASMPRISRALLVAALLYAAACGNGTPPRVPGAQLSVEWLTVAGHRITVEVAREPAEQQRGLMFRKSLPSDHGMLFLFPGDEVHSFWMRNT